MNQKISSVIKKYINSKSESLTSIKELKLGLTNRLYDLESLTSLTSPSQTKSNYLLKVYGISENDLINRELELFILKKRKKHRFDLPEILFQQDDFRIEEFIPNWTSLLMHYQSLPLTDNQSLISFISNELIYNQIMDEVRSIHSIQPIFKSSFKDYSNNKQNTSMLRVNNIIYNINELIKRLKNKPNLPIVVLNIVNDIEKYLNIERIIQKYNPYLVLSHNDLHAGNIMIKTNDLSSITVIDYEYSFYNFLGFDISSLFLESCFDLGYKTYPFFKKITDFSQIFEKEEVFLGFLSFLSKFRLDSKEESVILLENQEYFRFLLSISSVLWSLSAFSLVDYEKYIENSLCKYEFDYFQYACERIKVFYIYKDRNYEKI